MGVDAGVACLRHGWGRFAAWAGSALVVGLMGCADVEEGCLDYRALRVDIYAESACEDCCVYPGLDLRQVPGRRDSLGDFAPVTTRTEFVAANGDSVRVAALSYFLHDVVLELAGGDTLALLDTFSLRETESDEFALAERSLVRVSPLRAPGARLGTLLDEGEVLAVRLRFGLPADLIAADPVAQSEGSPLFIALDTALLFRDEATRARRLRSGLVVRERGGAVGDSTVVRDTTLVPGGASVPVRVALSEPFTLRRSFDLDLALLLPVASLVDLPPGETTAETFAEALYGRASVLSVAASR